MAKTFIILLWAGLLAANAHGAEVYKWVDENGSVHIGDTVPPKYEKKAKRLEYKELPPTVPARQPDHSAAQPQVPGAKSVPAAKSGSSAGGDGNYEEKMRKYRESLDCFAPYRNANGGVKAEAFQHCTEVPEPQRDSRD